MRELFTGWMGALLLATIVVAILHVCMQPDIYPREMLPPPSHVAEPISIILRAEPRPIPLDGAAVHPRRTLPPEGIDDLLITLSVDDCGIATDEAIEAQVKLFSRSDFSGWYKDSGWFLCVDLESTEVLKRLGLNESELKWYSGYCSGNMCCQKWRISNSYYLSMSYSTLDMIRVADNSRLYCTEISFPKLR